MIGFSQHLIILPIILPLFAASVMLMINERLRKVKIAIGLATLVSLFVVEWYLPTVGESAQVYALGGWVAPYGIVLVADPLARMMLLLTSVLGLGAFVFSLARWDRAGPRFHPLFMLQIMGINGIFLTGDMFNLFVFFEVMLAASYGLVLHGPGVARVKAGLHYVVINLVASSLFLVGVSLIYGVTGTLNMADLALRVAEVAADDRVLLDIGAAILGVAFLIKVGMWPVGFWLPATYAAASAPAAAVFAIMSKVGIYVVLRCTLLFSSPDGVVPEANELLFYGGIATIVYGSVSVMASRTLSRVATSCVFISSGTLLAALAMGGRTVLSGGLFYMLSSTLAVAAFFLLIELMNRVRGTNAAVLSEPVFSDEYHDPYEDGLPDESQGSVDIPVAVALLSAGFLLSALLLAGLPPMSGFIGKFAIMSGVLDVEGVTPLKVWGLIAVLTASSLATLVAIVRIGIEALWTPTDEPPPKVAVTEFSAIAGLLAVSIVLTVWSGPIVTRLDEMALWLRAPSNYVDVVLPCGQSGCAMEKITK